MLKRVSKNSHPKLFEWFEDLKEKSNAPKKLKLWVNGDDNLNGFAVSKNNIIVTGALLDCEPCVIRYMLAHEIIHVIHRETTFSWNFYIRFARLWNKTFQGVVLLQELRAAIDGAHLAGLSYEEVRRAHICIYKSLEINRNKKSYYRAQYPSRLQNIQFTRKYVSFHRTAADEIMDDYMKTQGVQFNKDKVFSKLEP